MRKDLLFVGTALAIVLSASAVLNAEETRRELGAHEHGHSTLNVAIEGGAIAMEFIAPGADIVGFEHPAASDEDKAAVDEAVAKLESPLELFVVNAEANCAVEHAHIEIHAEGHDDHGEHDDHAEEAGHHDHGEHEEHAGEAGHDEHGEHEEHAEEAGHDDHGEHEEHAEEMHNEFHAEYEIACANPEQINGISFALFDVFPNAEEIDVNLISDSGQHAFEVDSDDRNIDINPSS